MNILHATYAYYPYSYGGTEVYVSGLAAYLQEQGNQVTVIAGMPPAAFEDHPILFEDDHLKAVEYYFSSVRVVGIIMKHTTTTEIYTKYRKPSVASWHLLLEKLGTEKWDVMHAHAYTSAISLAMIKGAKIHSKNLKIVASYHIPLSCVKGTLMFGNELRACSVKPETNICTACVISSRQNWPLRITRKIAALIPSLANDRLPASLRIKHLVNEFIFAFASFDKEIHLWHVFSKQIRSILLLNGVEENRISLLEHGVSPFFISDAASHDRNTAHLFLYAGRFDKSKGFVTLLKAWCTLPQTEERQLLIVGQDKACDPDVLECMRAASVRKDIIWKGSLQQEAVAAIMKNVQCTIIPSECLEIGPLVFHEAIAAGSDVIASDIGGCAELATIYKKKSHLFETGNAGSLANKIISFKYSGENEVPVMQVQNYQKVLLSYQQLAGFDPVRNKSFYA